MHDGEALTLTIEEASKLIGISRSLGFSLARANKFPVPVIRCGRRILVPRKPLLMLLEGGNRQPPQGNGHEH